VSERKPRSGTILDFGLRILDSKKKEISVSLKFSSKTGKLYFEVFVQTLTTQVVRFTFQGFPLKAGFSPRRGRIFHIASIVDEPMNGNSYAQCATPQYLKTVQFSSVNLEP